jgi:hypothetical protein
MEILTQLPTACNQSAAGGFGCLPVIVDQGRMDMNASSNYWTPQSVRTLREVIIKPGKGF